MRAMGSALQQQLQVITAENEQRRLALENAGSQQQAASSMPLASASSSPVFSGSSSSSVSQMSSKLKGPSLRTFTGAMGFEVDSWLRSVKKQFDFHGEKPFPTDLAKIQYAALYFDGAALDWWDGEKAGVHTWEEFVERLHERYRPRLASEVARSHIAQLKQRGSVSTLCNRMLQLLSHVPTMHEDDKIFAFKQALDKALAAKVAEKQPKTLQDAMYAAVQAELYVGGKGNSSSQYGGGGFFSKHSSSSGGRSAGYGSSDSVAMEVNKLKFLELPDESKEDQEEDEYEPTSSTPNMHQLLAMMQDLKTQQHSLAATFQKRSNTSSSSSASKSSSSSGKVAGVSKEEFERCRREGLCLKCKQGGHIARDCSKPVQRLKW